MFRAVRPIALLVSLLASAAPASAADEAAARLAATLREGTSDARFKALEAIEARGSLDMAAPLIALLRFLPFEGVAFGETLDRLAGQRNGADWGAWMIWQEAHKEAVPFDGFDAFAADLAAMIDPAFRVFLYPGVAHEIRLEEIAWGGVRKDGIPALVDPAFVDAAAATWMEPDEPVFGVAVGSDVRAYPLRIMDWHEMANDVVGGRPVALAYCTLCGSAILFDTAGSGAGERYLFGSSGFLYRSNKLMYDQATSSLWNQFTGRPVVGKLTGTGIELPILPVVRTSWSAWLERHPETRVLSLDTGFDRDYTPGRPYGDYFASPELMFPAQVADERYAAKSEVFALRLGTAAKAWPLSTFEGGAVLNDQVGDRTVVVLGDAATREVRVFERLDLTFAGTPQRPTVSGLAIEVGEEALLLADGRRLARLPGHIAYWFAWQSYLPGAEVATSTSVANPTR